MTPEQAKALAGSYYQGIPGQTDQEETKQQEQAQAQTPKKKDLGIEGSPKKKDLGIEGSKQNSPKKSDDGYPKIPTWDQISKAYTPYKEGELEDINNAHIDSGEAPPSKLRGWVPRDAEYRDVDEAGFSDQEFHFTPTYVNAEVPAGENPSAATEVVSETPYMRMRSPLRSTDEPAYDAIDERAQNESDAHAVASHLRNPLTHKIVTGDELISATRLPGKVNPIMPMEDILEALRQANVANYRHPRQPVEGVSGFGQDGKLTSTQRIVAEQVRDKLNQGTE